MRVVYSSSTIPSEYKDVNHYLNEIRSKINANNSWLNNHHQKRHAKQPWHNLSIFVSENYSDDVYSFWWLSVQFVPKRVFWILNFEYMNNGVCDICRSNGTKKTALEKSQKLASKFKLKVNFFQRLYQSCTCFKDRVLAVWPANGGFYPGVISKVRIRLNSALRKLCIPIYIILIRQIILDK